MADDVRRRDVEQEPAVRTDHMLLLDPHTERHERPTCAQLVEMQADWPIGVCRTNEHHRCRNDPPPRRVATCGDDRLTEHLAAFHDGATVA